MTAVQVSHKKLLFLTLAILLIFCAVSPVTAYGKERLAQRKERKASRQKIIDPFGPNDHEYHIEHNGSRRTYVVHLPPSYNKNTATPVVLYLHGGGGDKRAAFIDGLDKYADKYGFLLIAPEAAGKTVLGHLRGTWNGGKWATGECCGTADDVGFIRTLIETVKTDYNVDERGIFATGISNGGLMTNRLACELSDVIAAIAVVAPAAIMSDCHPGRPIPVMHIHGTEDPANPLDGSAPKKIFKEGTAFAMPYKRMSPREVVNEWREIDQCSGQTITGYRKGGATCEIFTDCAQDVEVALCLIDGMGHTFPGGSQYLPVSMVGKVSHDMTFDQIWEFFARNKRIPSYED